MEDLSGAEVNINKRLRLMGVKYLRIMKEPQSSIRLHIISGCENYPLSESLG